MLLLFGQPPFLLRAFLLPAMSQLPSLASVGRSGLTPHTDIAKLPALLQASALATIMVDLKGWVWRAEGIWQIRVDLRI